MYKDYLKYFIGFFVTIFLIIVLIVLLFGGGKKQTTELDNGQKIKTLQDIADTDSAVRMVIAGNVRADQTYREIHITSSREGNNLEVIQGYEGNVIKSQGYSNNQNAYDTFLRSLQFAGYMQGDNDKKLADDRGHCPLGQRYIFEIIENSKIVQRYWTSDCGNSAPHTFLGKTYLVKDLFQMQIPDYDELTSDVEF